MIKQSNWRTRRAVQTLNQGGVIAYPTEAVYGLGCDPWDDNALLKILEIKQRSWTKGLIVVAADFNQLQPFIEPVSADILAKIEGTWPGPVTWLLPVREEVSPLLTGVHNTIAVRVTAHAQTALLCKAYGGAIVSTSANLAGMRPARTVQQARWYVPEVDYIMPGNCGGASKPSQIRDGLTGEVIR